MAPNVQLLGDAEFLEAYQAQFGALGPVDRILVRVQGAPLYRAWWTPSGGIVAWRDAWDLEGLLAHEFGHADGLDHPKGLAWAAWAIRRGLPTMGPLLRLRDPEGLRPRARAYLQERGL